VSVVTLQRTDKTPNDDKLFASLPRTDQGHVLAVHSLTNEDSVWRCYGAVKFLRALDPKLLAAISRLQAIDQRP